MGHGKRTWRSIGEVPERERSGEFAHPLPVAGELDRREFLGALSALSAFVAAGCGRRPEAIVARARGVQDRDLGEDVRYATSLLRRGRAMGVVATTREGRPVKLEGNPLHPASLGGSDAQMQAELLTFYHPRRSSTIRRGTTISSIDALRDDVGARVAAAKDRNGEGLAILTGPFTSPTLAGQFAKLAESMPAARIYRHDPLDEPDRDEGVRLALGRDGNVLARPGRAEVIVSFDDDFLGASPTSVTMARGFAQGRRGEVGGRISRVYVAEATPTITGAAADHRLAAAPSRVESLLLAFGQEIGALDAQEAPALRDDERAWIRAAAADARRAGPAAMIVGGRALAPALQALVILINEQLGSLGSTMEVIEPVEPEAGGADLSRLCASLDAKDVDLLLVLDSNPAYTAPADLDWRGAAAQAGVVVHAGCFFDETAEMATWHLPLAHAMESWGDALAFDGTLSLQQPLIRPLYDGLTPAQIIAMLIQPLVPDAREMVRACWRDERDPDDFEPWWRRSLHDGVAPESAPAPLAVRVNASRVQEEVSKWQSARRSDELSLVIRPDPSVGADQDAFNDWLQELPRPITKIVWSNALEMSPDDAARLHLQSEQIVRVRVGGRLVEAPVWITPGHAPGCVSLTLGYRDDGGAPGPDRAGVDAYKLRSSQAAWRVEAIDIEATTRRRRLVTTQMHGRMQGSDQIRTIRVGVGADQARERHVPLSLYPTRAYTGRQWGMSIDLTSCTGCGACTIACQAENNIPSVGPEQVHLGREMHWIRVDRYFQGPAPSPTILHQPVTCMQCEDAPCEVVCPVGATQHSSDGLNDMIYNRCIGTRYCSNNCPYKVRRFNFLSYTDSEEESLKLLRNPEVTVRARGVMEKCTYCVQRIRRSEIRARVEGRDLRDADIVTACQQACPTQAIVFGNINDAESGVSRAKAHPRSYGLLEDLGTRPRTTYLARMVNPHPDLARADDTGRGAAS